MPLPKTYKAAIFDVKGEPLKLVDVEWNNPGPGFIVIRVLACGICHRYFASSTSVNMLTPPFSDAAVKYALMGTLPRIPGMCCPTAPLPLS